LLKNQVLKLHWANRSLKKYFQQNYFDPPLSSHFSPSLRPRFWCCGILTGLAAGPATVHWLLLLLMDIRRLRFGFVPFAEIWNGREAQAKTGHRTRFVKDP
jgi:hypothetical protein